MKHNNNSSSKDKRASKQITISTTLLDSDLAVAIEYLNSGCQYGKSIAAETIVARIAPFVIPKDSPGWQSLAIRSANLLEAIARSIREYGDLQPSHFYSHSSSKLRSSEDLKANHLTTSPKLTTRSGNRDLEEIEPDIEEEFEDNDDEDRLPSQHIQSKLERIGLS